MKRATTIVLVAVFFAFVGAALLGHVCLICYHDHPYAARVQQAFLTEAGHVDETAVVEVARARAPD